MPVIPYYSYLCAGKAPDERQKIKELWIDKADKIIDNRDYL